MIIAERVLHVELPDGTVPVPVRLYQPRKDQLSYLCRIEIDWPDGRYEMETGGIDAMQALELAMKTIGAVLYTSTYHKQGRLFWDEPGTGYGFPVTRTIRDLLIGDDAEYQ